MPGASPALLRVLLLLHGVCFAYFFAWTLIASIQGHPIATLGTDAVSAVESSLREVQEHPEEGIHALARIQLPPYTGILHTTVIMLWAVASAFAFLGRGTRPLGPFALLMLQEELFLTSERLPHGEVLALVYLIALLWGFWRASGREGGLAIPCVFAGWLLVRAAADSFLSPTLTENVECYAELQASLLFAFMAAGRRIAPDRAE